MKIAGIYCIENIKTHKKYYGQSLDVMKRIYNHRYLLSHNLHHNSHLQGSWNKHGKSSFRFYVAETCDSLDYMSSRETYYIERDKTLNPKFGYNLNSGGERPDVIRGDVRSRLSASHKGKVFSSETRKKMSESKTGKPGYFRTLSTMQKLRLALTGRKLTKEQVEKLRNFVILRPKKDGCSSQYRGVSLKRNGKWDARVKVRQKTYLLGQFDLEIDAALAYNTFVMDNNLNYPVNSIPQSLTQSSLTHSVGSL